MTISNYIEINPQKWFGKAIIKGTRIAVADILNWLANGMSTQQILEDYPELKEEHIKASLLYAANRENHLGKASRGSLGLRISVFDASKSDTYLLKLA